MAFISDKWRSSSIITKIATFAMALNTLLFLVGNVILFAIDGGDSGMGTLIFFFLITTGIQTLLTFGIFKVNRVARGFTIFEGICSLLVIIVLVASGTATNNAAGGLMGFFFDIIWAIIPEGVKAILVIYLLPYVLQVISMFLLFVGGRDFKKKVQETV